MNGALRVRQLIEELKKRDPESVVQVWDPYNDRETDEVYVSDMRDGATMLCNANFGTSNTFIDRTADTHIQPSIQHSK